MSVVVKWKADGEYLCMFSTVAGPRLAWTKNRRLAHRFASQTEAKRRIGEHLRGYFYTSAEVAFVRLVPKRRAKPEPAVTPSEPTARDAVAGMLLRHGWTRLAENIVDEEVTLSDAVRRIRDENSGESDGDDACIAALEALAAREACRADHGAEEACADCAPGEQAESEGKVARLTAILDTYKAEYERAQEESRGRLRRVLELRAEVERLALEAHRASEQGAAEMRERAMDAVCTAADERVIVLIEAEEIIRRIRALPLSDRPTNPGAPEATTSRHAQDAGGGP